MHSADAGRFEKRSGIRAANGVSADSVSRLRITIAVATIALFTSHASAASSELLIGNGPEPETLDPHKSEGVSTANILRDLYEGLTAESPRGDIAPGVADRWTISADGRTYTFHLRDDARWSNGDPVTADDFVAGLRRSADPKTGSSYAQILSPIENADEVTAGRLSPDYLGVQALDANDLQINLKSPTPYFLGLLSHQAAYPLHRPSLQRFGDRFTRPGNLVGNGAYRLVDWVVQARVTLERNPYYWNNAHTSIDRVVYIPTEDAASELKRYRAGELDVTYQIPLSQAPWIRTHLANEFHLAPYLGVYYYGLNLTRAPFRDAPKLREALALALDSRLIVDKVMHGIVVPATGWVPPGIADYVPQRSPWSDWPRERRVAEARKLYAESGYSAERPLEVEIRYNTQQDNKRIATVIAAMWKQSLGAHATLVNEEWKVFLQNRRARRLTQVFVGSWIGDYSDPFNFLEILQSGSGLNASGYASPQYDALLAAIAAEADPQARTGRMEAAEQLLLADLPVIPIYFYASKHLVKPHVQGWQDNVADHHYSKDLSLTAGG
jgi:oligopeptide transport system substrate-binding protein